MANKKSALKAHRQSEKRAIRNKSVKSAIRTYVKKAVVAIGAGEETAAAAVREAMSNLDRAARKGIIHPNAAARRKSRMMTRLNVAAAAAAAPAPAPAPAAVAPVEAPTKPARKPAATRKPKATA